MRPSLRQVEVNAPVWAGAFALAAAIGLARQVRRKRARWDAPAAGGSALITGASSGIGEAFARILAAEGYDIVLVARREEQLASLARELGAAHGIKATYLVCDLATEEGIRMTSDYLRTAPDLVMLINNAGVGLRGRFWEAPLDVQQQMIRLHVQATVALSYAALPGMVARGQGAIINVASLSGFMALSCNNTYSSTKRYIIQHSEGLALELAGSNVRVQALCPGLTHSQFHDRREYTRLDKGRYPTFMWQTADQVAADSLAAIRQGGPVVFVPGRLNRAMALLLRSNLTKAALNLLLPLVARLLPQSSTA